MTTRAQTTGGGNARHALKARRDDLYQTPPVAVQALLRVEKLPKSIWEPACGPGSIVRVLRSNGFEVIASDLVDYSSPDQDFSGWDFLMERIAPVGVQAIVSNPPFKIASKFVAHALNLCPRVYMLLRLNFIEAGNKNDAASIARRYLLDEGHLARVRVFRNRLPMMHREGWTGNKTNSFTAFAWFVWDRNYKGPTILDRILWEGT